MDVEAPPNSPIPPAIMAGQQDAPPDKSLLDGGRRLRSSAFPIVGLGASAGGLKALVALLAELPRDIGMGFVVIQHLDPHHGSQLPFLLTKNCSLVVEEAVDGVVVQPNRVYVITPNARLCIEHGILHVTPREQEAGAHHPIDAFLLSLAADRPGRAIGVILSGTGSDGTVGLAAIKAARGITFAQDNTAEYPGMPQSAVSHGNVDFILRPIEIANELKRITEFGFPALPPLPVTPDEEEPTGASESPQTVIEPEQYATIMKLLHSATGIEFTHYRSTTIIRRTQRRMSLCAKSTFAEYARCLVDIPGEIDALARDILIHVTSFFRDRSVFDALKAVVLPSLIERCGPESSIRLWVVGCSTGQEVYSLAILLLDHFRSMTTIPNVQIFATDISDWALSKARIGYYPESIADEIPADLLNRYFTREGTGYRVAKMIRDLCVFAKHDVTADTPFSRIDLISCRNVLIYLGPVLQKYVLPTFHFSLKPGGYLLLGTSESVGRSSNLYETIDESHRIYRSIATPGRLRPTLPQHRPIEPGIPPPVPQLVPSGSEMQRAADQIVLGRFAPPGVLINEAMEVMQFRGRTHLFLEPAPGEPSRNLLSMVPFGVSHALREAVVEAKRQNLPIRREQIAHRRENTFREIAFEVIPIKLPSTDTGYLILFEEQASSVTDAEMKTSSASIAPPHDAHSIDPKETIQLRTELAAATDYVHSLLGLNQGLVEQMKESHDEAQSSTEEYRSTNEELQTAKEEVESTNEELITINEELRYTSLEREKISEALRASSELMTAIVDTMRYPLLVLTSNLMIDSANQAFLDAFVVNRSETIGRLVYDIGDGQWNIPELRRLLEDILPNNSAFDDFVVTHDFPHKGRMTMLLNARRLQGGSDMSRRIVLVIADITERSRITMELKQASTEQLRSNSELEQFASVAAHDLQEPLRMVSSYVGLLEHQYGSLFDDRARKYMTYATNGAQRMGEMINGILAYSLLGHESESMCEMDCGKSMQDALENIAMKISDAHAIITIDPLPRLTASAAQLTQLFQNLISNSVKYHFPGRPPQIHVSAQETDKEWTFAVTDNGIGMHEDEYQRIFLPFHRGDSYRQVKGCGIGLATCKKIIEHHSGRIWVTSQVNVGSTFSFTIPK